jgi:16S rRNA (guanine(966)-N(2))-methyltransferase RsmD
MRIIAGSAKGCRLRSLKGQALRPTADRVRESVFGALGERVVGARFLDLYAGAGTVGLEALSRGAEEAVFVESHRPAGRAIAENADRCRLAAQASPGARPRARVMVLPVGRALARLEREERPFDLVFVDPPYGTGEAERALAGIAARPGLVSEGGMVICQHSRREEVSEEIGRLRRTRTMRFGETVVDFYQVWQEASG